MKDISKYCPIAYAMDIFGGKWTLPIIWLINDYPNIRYGQIKKVFPLITNTVLTRTLQQLEQYEFLTRTDYGENPPKVEYSLSQRGKEILPLTDLAGKLGEKLMSEEGKKYYYPDAKKILENIPQSQKNV